VFDLINSDSTNFYELLPSVEPVAQVHQNLDLLIALRKGTTSSTKPCYPLANYLSFEKFSSTHRTYLTSLNTTTIVSYVSKALIDKKWKKPRFGN